MIKDITIGQYFPGTSAAHRLDPRTKILMTVAYIVILFLANNLLSLAVGAVFTVLAYAVSKVPIKMILKSLKPIIPIALFTAVLNLFFIDGRILFEFWVIRVTYEGIATAALLVIRIVLLIAGSSLLTYVTSPITLTDGIESLFSPLNKIKVPVHELAMMMTIALRFIPTLIEETDKIMSAQKARGADIETGGLIKRAKALVPILIPLFVSAFRRADELALAMECRCYRGGEGRTKLRKLKYGGGDVVAAGIMLILMAGTLLVNYYAPAIL